MAIRARAQKISVKEKHREFQKVVVGGVGGAPSEAPRLGVYSHLRPAAATLQLVKTNGCWLGSEVRFPGLTGFGVWTES